MKISYKFIVAAACFIVLDVATGLIKAFKNKNFNSSVMREGFYHKMSFVIYIVLAVMIDCAQHFIDLGYSLPVTDGCCTYIIFNEIGSIIENAYAINPKAIPKKMRGLFAKIKE
jgi:toxin secretion/phage lysis holin